MEILPKGKIKNKFIYFIILIIISIIGFQVYNASFLLWRDTNSYIINIRWNVVLNEKEIKVDKKEVLEIGDQIKTIWKESIWVIKWWDWSITRLAWDSEVKINELNVEKDLSKINLSFSLFSWKSWSNVVSFLWEESYFKQSFEDIEASVRWTVFNVDLEKDYVSVEKHEITLQKNWEKKLIWENKAFDIKSFSFIELQKFLNEIKDKTWEELNKTLDKQYIEELKKALANNFNWEKVFELISKTTGVSWNSIEEIRENISTLWEKEKKKAYEALLSKYQEFNFISPESQTEFSNKNDIKQVLIELAPEEEKKSLVKYSIYDLQDAINLKQFEWIKWVSELLNANKEFVNSADFPTFNETINKAKEQIENIKQKFQNVDSEIKWLLDKFK